jgi:hypothetical protein
MGTGMTEDLAISTLAGDYGTPAAAYSVRKVRTAYSGALMDVRRDYDNVTSSIGFVSNGDLDTGSLLDWVVPGRNDLPGAYDGLAAAYSLRKVSASYSGDAIEVRRDWDNESGSFGFDANGDLDTVSLLTFVTGSAGTGSGFVQTWYDQSGNGRHATQTTASSQPLIVSSGLLVTSSVGKPAMKFDSTDELNLSEINLTGSDYSFFLAYQKSNNNSNAILFVDGTYNAYYDLSPSNLQSFGNDYITITTGGFPTSSLMLIGGIFDRGVNSYIYRNSTLLGSGSASTNNQKISRLFPSSFAHADSLSSEILIYNNDQSSNRPLIENNINNYYNIYTGSNHGFVARWYDQSGNNNHATQTNTTRQPQIVGSGSVLNINSKPALSFDAINDNMNILNSATNLKFLHSNLSTIITVNQMNSTTGNALLGSNAGTGNNVGFYLFNQPTGFTQHVISGILVNLSINNTTNTSANTQYLNFVLGNPASTTLNERSLIYINDSTVNQNNSNTGTLSTNNSTFDVQIGAVGNNSETMNGHYQELIIYPNNQTINREAASYGINNYYNIYTQPTSSNWTTSSFTIKADSTSISGSLNNKLTSGIPTSGPLGLITVSRTGSNSLTIARNGVTSSFAVPASGALSTGIYLGAINNNGLALGNSPLNISFASVGTGLTGADINTLSVLAHSLRYSLRGLDPDAVLFLANTVLTNETQIQAVNNLVLDLKANNLWDKMTAIYPFVGASGDTHKYNLKNPTQFTVLFEGGWNHTATGAATNGVNTRGNTQISPSAHLIQDDTHISIYARSTLGTRTSVNVDIGNRPGGFFLAATWYSNNFLLSDIYSNFNRIQRSYPGGSTSTNGLGYFIFQRTSPTSHTVYKNATLLATNSTNTGGTLPSAQMWIGDNGTISEWSDREYSFISFGRGFTPTEVTTLTSIIQTYQTSLSRQI